MKLIYMASGLVGLFGAVNAGISVTKPCPRFSNAEWCPPIPDGVQADANMNTPVTNINSQDMFEMCRHKQEWPVPVANWTAGQPVTVEFEVKENTATGGYCQFSISYDGQNFAVIDEVLGDCFFQVNNNSDAVQVASQTFNLPDNIPGSEYAIFAWTWLSPGSQGDFYMNCADVNITNANNSTSYSGKQMVIANAPGYPELIDISANQAAIQSQYADASLIPITPNLGARKRHVSSKTGEDCGDPNVTSDNEDGSSSDSDSEGSGGKHGKDAKGAFGESDVAAHSDVSSQVTEAAYNNNEGKNNGDVYASSYYSSGGYVVGTDGVTASSGFSTGGMDSYTGEVYNNQQQYQQQQQQQQQEEDCEEDTNYETDCEEEMNGNGQNANNNIGNSNSGSSNGQSQGCSCNGQNSSPFASTSISGNSGNTSSSSNFNNMMMMMIMKLMQNSMTPNQQMYGGAINPYMGSGMYGSNMYGNNMLGSSMYSNGMYSNGMYGNGMYGNGMYGNGMYGNSMYGNNMNNMNGNMNGYMGGGSNTNTDSNININLDLNGNYNQGNYGQGNYGQGNYGQGGNNQGGYSQGGYNQNGNNQNRYGQNGYNQNDYSQNRYGQNDYNQNRYGQNDYSQGRNSQNDYNQGRYGQDGYGQNYDQNNGYAKDLENNYSDLPSSSVAPTSSESLRYETIVSLGYVTETVYSGVMITEEIAVTEYVTETNTSAGYLIAPTSVAPQANVLNTYRRASKPVTVLENGAAQPANFQYANPANS